MDLQINCSKLILVQAPWAAARLQDIEYNHGVDTNLQIWEQYVSTILFFVHGSVFKWFSMQGIL